MKALAWGVFILLTLVIQATIVPLVAVQGIKPDILLIVVVSAGLLYGKEMGLGAGFFAGLMQDLASGNVFGLHTLSKMAAGYCFGLAERKVFKENYFLPIIAMAAASLLNSAIMLVFVALRGFTVDWAGVLMHSMLPAMVYNIIAAIPVHRLFAAFTRKVQSYYA